MAVIETHGARQRLLLCNQAAAAEGLHPGMSIQAALALAPELICRPRDQAAEEQALQRLATWATQFSSLVSVAAQGEVLLEVGASLRLFGGREALSRRLHSELAGLGYHAQLAAAPSPAAASLLARAGQVAWVTDVETLEKRLRSLPVSVLPLEEAVRKALESVGLRYWGDLSSQPRDALARRFGVELVSLLERAMGQRPDPRTPHVPPSRFHARLELPVPVPDCEALLFAVKRLLRELGGVLAARGEGVNVLRLVLHHAGAPNSRLRIGLTRPGRDPNHWLDLVRERLERFPLPQPVEALSLVGGRQFPLDARNGDLFETRDSIADDGGRLLERLEARLGRGVVAGIQLLEDHRPERAWKPTPPGATSKGEGRPARPLWLLQQPMPLETEARHQWRLQGLERVESGWWDGSDVARDYFLAQTPRGERLWIYRDRRSRDWFLHGFFA